MDRAVADTGVRLLDFLIVGAAKSGTTSLHHYLKLHPQIFLPESKEVPFFATDHSDFQTEWAALVGEHYASVPRDILWGKVTPQYMRDERIAQRIWSAMAAVKVIAILRDPVERAYSYYKMDVRFGKERRSLRDAIAQQVEPSAATLARMLPIGDEFTSYTYVVRGEYGRILASYFDCFPRDQIRVLFMDDLIANPQALMDDILLHIGLPTGFAPANLNEVYNSAVGWKAEQFQYKMSLIQPARVLWRRLPVSLRKGVKTLIEKSLRSQVAASPELLTSELLTSELRAQLVDFYRPDVEKLESLLSRKVPWRAFQYGASI